MSDLTPRRPVTSTRVRAVEGDQARDRPDKLVTEEPMEIRVHGPGQAAEPLVVTMRTPGNDFELAAGFCVTERIVDHAGGVAAVSYCLEGAAEQRFNIVTVELRHPLDRDRVRERSFAASASCGLCGATTLDQIEIDCAPVGPGPVVDRSVLVTLPDRLREAQAVFDATGGLHAAATFDVDGRLLALREDVGRHNALDKLVGHAVLAGELPLSDRILLVSGRVSFEIVQKAAMAGIPVLCAVSAPSSLAVQAADRLGQTVVGFLRGDRFNVYTHPERISLGKTALGTTDVEV